MTEIYIDKLIDAIEKLARCIERIGLGDWPEHSDMLDEVLETMRELKEFRKPRD